MQNEAGCGFAIIAMAIGVVWLVFFYSTASFFYLRHEFALGNGSVYVQCRYVNAVATEWPAEFFWSQQEADQFYCPRWKHAGDPIRP